MKWRVDKKETSLYIKKYLEKHIDFDRVRITTMFRDRTIYYDMEIVSYSKGIRNVFKTSLTKGKYIELLKRALESEGYVVERLITKIKDKNVYYELYYGLVIEEGLKRIRRL